MYYQYTKPFIFNDQEIKYSNHYIPYVKSCVILNNPLFSNLSTQEKLEEVFELLFPGSEPNPILLQEFFNYLNPYPSKSNSSQPSFDFLYDEALIYASFLQAYNIDLSKPNKNLTIQKFLALFQGLPQTTRFAEVMQMRTRPVPKRDKYNSDYVNSIIKAKESVRLYKNYNQSNQGDIFKPLGALFKH